MELERILLCYIVCLQTISWVPVVGEEPLGFEAGIPVGPFF